MRKAPLNQMLDVSPFIELQCPFGTKEAMKMIILLPTVLPRLLIGLVTIVIIALINVLAVLGCDMNLPLPPFRRKICLYSKELLVVVFYMVGFHIKVNGKRNLEIALSHGAVVVFNHVSWLDAFILVWLMAPSGVSISRNQNIPVISLAVKALQTIYIPSGEKNNTNRVTSILRERVNHPGYCQIQGFPILVMAPEATCSHGRCLLKFKTGAFTLERPILPIIFQYDSKCHNPAWTLGNVYWHFLRMMCQFRNSVTVTILPLYFPSASELESPTLFASNVRQTMADALKVPLIEQSQEDYVTLLKNKVNVSLDGRRITQNNIAINT